MGYATVAATVTREQLANQIALTACPSCFGPVPDDGQPAHMPIRSWNHAMTKINTP